MYVDLNPIRAAMAESLDKSQYTSSFHRLESHQGREIESSAAAMQMINQGRGSEDPEDVHARAVEAATQSRGQAQGTEIPRWLVGSDDAEPAIPWASDAQAGFACK